MELAGIDDTHPRYLATIASGGKWSQDHKAEITNIEWHEDKEENFDGTLEEVLHLVQRAYTCKWPEAFDPYPGSTLADAMDLARGG